MRFLKSFSFIYAEELSACKFFEVTICDLMRIPTPFPFPSGSEEPGDRTNFSDQWVEPGNGLALQIGM
jgi:hypothetical protein